jgi:hypothetical protein
MFNYLFNQNKLNRDKILEILITPIYNKVLKEKSWKNYIFFIQQVHISDILNKKFDIIKFQLFDKGFPFQYNKEIIQNEIKDILLNKILFIKDEIDETSLSELVEEVSKKTFNRNFSLKPELLIHISLI